MTLCKVSIVIPVYNAGAFLEECLNSVINQTYRNIEIIIVNDGSTDDSELIIDRFRSMDGRITVITQVNQGLSAARNSGISGSTGEYICFVDSDDWIVDYYIERSLSNMTGADLVLASYNRLYKSRLQPRHLGWSGMYPASALKRRLLGLCGAELSDPSQIDSMSTACCKLYKANIVKRNNLWFVDTNLVGTSEDLVFNLHYIECADHVFVLDEPLYFYRKNNSNSLTTVYKSRLSELWHARHDFIVRTVAIQSSEEVAAYRNRLALNIVGLCLNEISNPGGRNQIRSNVRKIIEDKKHKNALNSLEFRYFPLHWKIYFMSAKHGNVSVLIALTYAISWLLARKNR